MNKGMTSVEEKKLLGTYRKDRHEQYDGKVPGDTLVDIDPPTGLSDVAAEQWRLIVPALCTLGIVYRQDAPTLYQAFGILTEIERIIQLKKKLDNKSLLSKNLRKWTELSKLELSYIKEYNNIMRLFFVTPKERLRAIGRLKGDDDKPKNKDPVDGLLE